MNTFAIVYWGCASLFVALIIFIWLCEDYKIRKYGADHG
jgi:hypothetical protein